MDSFKNNSNKIIIIFLEKKFRIKKYINKSKLKSQNTDYNYLIIIQTAHKSMKDNYLEVNFKEEQKLETIQFHIIWTILNLIQKNKMNQT
jgi:hypothetical protein